MYYLCSCLIDAEYRLASRSFLHAPRQLNANGGSSRVETTTCNLSAVRDERFSQVNESFRSKTPFHTTPSPRWATVGSKRSKRTETCKVLTSKSTAHWLILRIPGVLYFSVTKLHQCKSRGGENGRDFRFVCQRLKVQRFSSGVYYSMRMASLQFGVLQG
jgi:hypothetical protein